MTETLETVTKKTPEATAEQLVRRARELATRLLLRNRCHAVAFALRGCLI